MDKNIMGSQLCALSNNEIVKRRRPVLGPIALSIAGIVVLVATTLWLNPEAESLKIGLLLLGWSCVFVGGIVTALRSFDSEGMPYDLKTGCYLKPLELNFQREQLSKVHYCCQKGDVMGLKSLSQTSGAAIIVALYTAADDRWWAYQSFEYVDLEYRPLEELKFCRK